MSSKSHVVESHGSINIQNSANLYIDGTGAYNAVSGTASKHFITSGLDVVLSSGAGSTITLNPGVGATGGLIVKKQAMVTQLTSTTTGVTVNTTLGGTAGIISCFTSTLAAGSSAVFTVTNAVVTTNSIVMAKITDYSGAFSTNGLPIVTVDNLTNGTFDIAVSNAHSANALGGVLKIGYFVI